MINSKKVFYIGILFIFLSIYGLFEYYTTSPIPIIYISQYLLVTYLFLVLVPSKFSLFVLIYPMFKFLWYQFYMDDWFLIGDVISYMKLLSVTFVNNGVNLDTLLSVYENYGRFYYLTIINMLVPMMVFDISFGSENSFLLLYFNDLIFVALTVIFAIAYRGMISNKHLALFVLFILFSPTILSLTAVTDRHLFTLFALLFFVRGFILYDCENKYNIYLFLSLFMIYLNKKELLLAIMLYVVLLNISLLKKPRNLIFSILILFITLFFLKNSLLEYMNIQGMSTTGFASTLQNTLGFMSIVIIAPLKYIYAILAPFPWYKYDTHLNISYGSYFVLAAWYMNSIFGLAIVISLVKYFRYVKKNTFYYKYFILFGIIMSTTIILGHIGHAQYLSVYYVLFLPLFFVIGRKKTLIVLSQSFLTIVVINIVLFQAGL